MVTLTNSVLAGASSSLYKSSQSMQTSQARLSTGQRINSAADDSAGMAIATRLNAQSSSIDVAKRNAANGISLSETAGQALSTMNDLLSRARDLKIQYSDGTLTTEDKDALKAEITDINSEFTRIGSTDFAGVKLLDGSLDVAIAIDANGNTKSITSTYDASSISIDLDTDSITDIDALQTAVSGAQSKFGSLANSFSSAIENLSAVKQGVDAAYGRIMDTDYAAESANMAKQQILQQASMSVLAQANQSAQSVMALLR